jgi:hypothetical protein
LVVHHGRVWDQAEVGTSRSSIRLHAEELIRDDMPWSFNESAGNPEAKSQFD